MSEYNKDIIRRVVEEIWNQGNLDLMDELFADNYKNTDPANPQSHDLASLKIWAAMIRNAFPDFHVAIEDMIAEQDRVAKRFIVHGTHQGDFFGIPASGKMIAMTGITCYRLQAGKIIECVWSYDMLGLLQQLGVVPELAPA